MNTLKSTYVELQARATTYGRVEHALKGNNDEDTHTANRFRLDSIGFTVYSMRCITSCIKLNNSVTLDGMAKRLAKELRILYP